ncbi:MAG: NTP transferase domain-containing protein [Bacteroidota bacterium]|nr:NTP transferase domain-containing protein [Bacteroidota bacterium]
MERKIATVIMAAGKGTRMKNPDKAKVMFEVLAKPMIEHVAGLAHSIESTRTIVVVGFHREEVIAHVKKSAPWAEFAVQEPQLGTGHAVLQTEPQLKHFEGDVLVLSGDVPLLKRSTMLEMISFHRRTNSVATILTAELDDPSGYGRIIRNGTGNVTAIVEHKDASDEQRAIREINSGIYLFDNAHLFDALHHIGAHNVQDEYYLTDVFHYFWKHGLSVSAKVADDFNEIRGVNTAEQLEEACAALLQRNSPPVPIVKSL